MNFRNILSILFLAFMALMTASCKKDFGNLNSPTEEQLLDNPTKAQLNNLVTGTESAMRNNLGQYLDDVSVIGREIYRFSTGDPRYTTDLLGASDARLDNNGFYLTNTWASRYRVVRNCNLLIKAARASTFISPAEASGYTGFAKTMMAYQLLLNLNLTYENGIRVDVDEADNLGPVQDYTSALASIAGILDEANDDLSGAEIAFPLTSGFEGFTTAASLRQVNRALAARVAAYREEWQEASAALQASFLDINGDFDMGVYHVFGTGTGDQVNPAFFPRNQAGDVRLAHPSFISDISANDARISKTALRTEAASFQGLSSNRDVWVYTSPTAPIPLIRNEELILLFAETNLQLDQLATAVDALDVIRNEHGLADYSGTVSKEALTDELLRQRRFSLFFEGHRWVDLRRYGRLNELPIDRPDDDVWQQFPIPATEQ